MSNEAPELDMTIEGKFVSPPKPPLSTRILIWAVIIAVLAGAVSVAAFALWLALIILPVAVAACVVAWLAWRFQVWRARSRVSPQRDLWRP